MLHTCNLLDMAGGFPPLLFNKPARDNIVVSYELTFDLCLDVFPNIISHG